MNIKMFLTAIVIAVCCIPLPLVASVINVPEQCSSIQAGIDLSAEGDTILVAPGMYTGEGNRDISFSGKTILLKSRDGPEETVIDCNGSPSEVHRCFIFSKGSAAVVEDFTITGGYEEDGGAVFCLGSSPTFRGCIFSGNHAEHMGGAIFSVESQLVVESCVFVWNFGYDGGGAILFMSSFDSPSLILNCTFSGNSTGYYGGAIYCYFASPEIRNSIFTFNVQKPHADGTAIYCYTHGIPYEYSLVISCSDIYGNTDGDWIGCISDQAGSNGNFSLDPLFCDTSINDLRIPAESPCNPDINSCGVLIGALEVSCCSTDVDDPDDVLPEGVFLSQNYPNPFNSSTIIMYSLPIWAHTSLSVYNVLGQRIAILVDQPLSRGSYTANWNGRNSSGRPVASGVYFYRLESGNFTDTRKMVLLK